ncbi:response regulator transcription factor [Aureibaculum sp. 2210JD6-5]|uniref:response regulator transcription factor n=1 Tax=Aureibaculum sp. 2210JD6-5 TaxID=3103957 RepID=UPI002AAD132A|nr:response regulator transcription factor [Aureibaculum sp. 2210JD6-5]MDY7394799.1 response regulator transcription factor [Aureibaculum sp. 2210JD6-5]
MKILIVEDEVELLDSMASYLKNEDFICEKATSFFDAEDKIVSFKYDIIILDITLPDGSGIDLLKLVKEQSSKTGVLIVSAKDSLDDKLKGLDLGADDYITKPFHLAELNSRINSLIRRRNFDGDEFIEFNEIRVDPSSKEVTVHGKPVELTKKEFNLLLYFITNKNKVLTKESIAEHLWGDDIEMADSYDFIYTHMGNLRKKINKLGGNNYLQTMYGLGYKFTDTLK